MINYKSVSVNFEVISIDIGIIFCDIYSVFNENHVKQFEFKDHFECYSKKKNYY